MNIQYVLLAACIIVIIMGIAVLSKWVDTNTPDRYFRMKIFVAIGLTVAIIVQLIALIVLGEYYSEFWAGIFDVYKSID